jgi:hypothetical protein
MAASWLTRHQGLSRRWPSMAPCSPGDGLAAVVSTGVAAGGVAAAPVVGTAASLAVSVGDMVGFLEASALFILAVAEVHGIRIDDLETRRTLVFAVLLGDSGAKFVEKAAARTGKYWGSLLTDAIPMSTINYINKVLGRWFITKYGTKQGIIVIGRLAPFGIGAGIGGAGNALFGRTVISGARRAFGPPGEWRDATCDEEEPEPSQSQWAEDESREDPSYEAIYDRGYARQYDPERSNVYKSYRFSCFGTNVSLPEILVGMMVPLLFIEGDTIPMWFWLLVCSIVLGIVRRR